MVYTIEQDLKDFINQFPIINQSFKDHYDQFRRNVDSLNIASNFISCNEMEYTNKNLNDKFNLKIYTYDLSYFKTITIDNKVFSGKGKFLAITVLDLLNWIFKIYPKQTLIYPTLTKIINQFKPINGFSKDLKNKLNGYYSNTLMGVISGFKDVTQSNAKKGTCVNLEDWLTGFILFDSSQVQIKPILNHTDTKKIMNKNWKYFLENLLLSVDISYLIDRTLSYLPLEKPKTLPLPTIYIDPNEPKSLAHIATELYNQTKEEEYMRIHKQITRKINKRMEEELKNQYMNQIFKDIREIRLNDYPVWALRNTYLKTWCPNTSDTHLKKLIFGDLGPFQKPAINDYNIAIDVGQSRNRYKYARSKGSKKINQKSHFWGCSGCAWCQHNSHIKHQGIKQRRDDCQLDMKQQLFELNELNELNDLNY